jgi:hypothetical protein
MPTDRSRPQVLLSPRALVDFETVSRWKGERLTRMLQIFLEMYHSSPEFEDLLARATAALEVDSGVEVDEAEEDE